MTKIMPSLFLLLLAASLSTISAFHSHSLPTPSGASAVQRLLVQKRQQRTPTPILFAADEDGSAVSNGDGEGYTGGSTTTATGGAISVSRESTLKVLKKCPDCDLCDGSGRILGGIGTVLEWWPIKAYRPCPNLIERGGRYDRAGQGLDEIAFGRDSTFQAGE